MTTLDAIILGIVQGLTEFLPVSSSGHLILVEHLLGLKDLDHYILFDLICHLGTLLAIILVFSAEIKELFSKESKKLWQLLLATLPLIPLVAVMKSIKAFYATPNYLGFFFIVTGAVLFLGIRFSPYSESLDQRKNFFGSKHRWRDAFAIGLGQAMAILPGVSRSAVTISSARLLGWTIHDAMIFSFLLAIPTILGGILLELIKLWQSEPVESSLTSFNYILGFFVSFAFGLSALHLLIRLATHNRLSYFAWYCLFLGLATTCYFSV